jgi:hypothetical protein
MTKTEPVDIEKVEDIVRDSLWKLLADAKETIIRNSGPDVSMGVVDDVCFEIKTHILLLVSNKIILYRCAGCFGDDLRKEVIFCWNDLMLEFAMLQTKHKAAHGYRGILLSDPGCPLPEIPGCHTPGLGARLAPGEGDKR